MVICILAATGLALAFPSASPAQQPEPSGRTVKVGLYVSPPFVMEDQGNYTGMAMELWEALARPLALESEYRMFPTVRSLVDATANGEVDVAVTNLSITQGRAQRIDFTQPWFDAGQRIMVNERQGAGFWQVIDGLQDFGFVRSYLWLGGLAIAATIVLTLLDRSYNPDFPRRWRDGIAESFFAVMSIVAGKPTGRKNLFGWMGRIWQGLWLIFGIAVLAFVTSSVTSVMTTLSLTNKINSLSDLPGKTVGASAGSVSESFARAAGFDLRTYPHVDEAVEALTDGDINAILGDAPVLEYYTHVHPEVRVDVVGGIFVPDKYGFALARHSPLTEPLTIELLGARERGLVEELRKKYFGDSP